MRLIGSLKLSHQLLLLLLSIPLFLVISLLYYSAGQHVAIRNKPLEQLALSTSSTVAEKIDRNLNERYSDVQSFAFNQLAVNRLLLNDSDSTLQKFMNHMVSYYHCYDLMMLCDISGKVIEVNTKNQSQQLIESAFLKGKSVNDQDWFRSSIVVGGPVGGAYFSDFNRDDDVATLFKNAGYGIDFSAPVRNSKGTIIGVWRTRVSWAAVTQQIRKESEESLQRDVTGSLILLMNKQGQLIDADKENTIQKINIGKNNLFKHFDFEYAGIHINDDDFLYGWAESSGSFSYKGNKWKYLTLIPKVKITDTAIFLHSDWTALFFFSIGVLIIGVLGSLLFVRTFSKRINRIKLSIQKLSTGEPEMIDKIVFRDEIGEMALAINTLNNNFKKMAAFSTEIGKGNLNASFTPLSEKDHLGISLLQMKQNLETSQQEILEQKWISDRLTGFGEVLREQASASVVFSKAIAFLAKSIQAYQAVLFTLDNHNHAPVIRLRAGYALSENRLKQEPLLWGEGHVGQCIKDKEKMIIRDIPEDYSNPVNSGLGQYAPVEVVIIPILFNNTVCGAYEFSSFKLFDSTSVQFLEKAGEYLGYYITQTQSVVSGTTSNKKNKMKDFEDEFQEIS